MQNNIEQIVSLPIVNPETGVKARTKYMGKVDRIEGQKLIDYKGVANPIRFIAQLRIGYQVELYALALKYMGVEIHEVEYRLLSRPAIKLCGKDKKGAKDEGITAEEFYYNRCVEWLLEDSQKIVSHHYMLNQAKMKQAAWYLWESSRRLLENHRNNRWMINTGACFAYERECQFMRLCDTVQNGGDWEWLARDQYRTVDQHPELDGKANENTVTQTSLGDLHRCEMLYYWKHVRSLRLGTGEESEALRIGSAMHAGLEHIDQGVEAAHKAVDAWDDGNPTLGETETNRRAQDMIRAKAMIQAAAIKWPSEVPSD